VPQVKLVNGLFRTNEELTSVPTAANYMMATLRWKIVSCRGGRPTAGVKCETGKKPSSHRFLEINMTNKMTDLMLETNLFVI
jgi:hypothetical protein